MRGEKAIDPHCLRDLRYRLTTGLISLRPLRVLAEREMRWRDWRVRFLALGTSHAVVLERGEERLTELLSCAAPLENANCLCLLEAGAEFAALSASAFGLDCRVALEPFSLDAGDSLQTVFAADSQMRIAYPSSQTQGAYAAASGASDELTPVTRIGWRVSPQELFIETVHTYPQEGRGLRSRSRFVPIDYV